MRKKTQSKYTQEFLDRIRLLYVKQGESCSNIAKKFNTTTSTIRNLCARHKFTRERVDNFSCKDKEKMREMYENGISMTKIAADFTTSYHIIRYCLEAEGVRFLTDHEKFWKEYKPPVITDEPEHTPESSKYFMRYKGKRGRGQASELPKSGECKYPIGQDPIKFCKVHVVRGKSYCEHHCNVCFSKKDIDT